MTKYPVSVLLTILVCVLCLSSIASAAEVYYVGGKTSRKNKSTASASRSPSPLIVNGRIGQEVSWQDVGGNLSKSFLERGTDYISELYLNAFKDNAVADYRFTGNSYLRKTDMPDVDMERTVRVKQIYLKLENEDNSVEFGDIYTEFSRFTVSYPLEGFRAKMNRAGIVQYQFLAARKYNEDSAISKYQRDVVGAKADCRLFADSDAFTLFRLGLQAVTNQDDSSTLTRNSNTKDLRNTVVSTDGQITLTQLWSLQYELAQSFTVEDEDSPVSRQLISDHALRFEPSFRSPKGGVRYLYYYVQPQFLADTGSAVPDRLQHQVTIDYSFHPRLAATMTENYYYDHLKGSTRTKRTTGDEKYINFFMQPFEQRKTFSLRPYMIYQDRTSDDPGRTAAALTQTYGLSLNENIGRTSYGMGYEYRKYCDENNHGNSEYFNRLRANLSRDQKFLGRRLYYYNEWIAEVRTARRNTKKDDVNFIIGVSGQYDALSNMVSRFGYNVQDTNAATPENGFVNHRTFLEFDFLLYKKQSSHFVMRGERNIYMHENEDQEYTETRAIAKLTSNF
jgi:hypothetical protein